METRSFASLENRAHKMKLFFTKPREKLTNIFLFVVGRILKQYLFLCDWNKLPVFLKKSE